MENCPREKSQLMSFFYVLMTPAHEKDYTRNIAVGRNSLYDYKKQLRNKKKKKINLKWAGKIFVNFSFQEKSLSLYLSHNNLSMFHPFIHCCCC